METYNIHLLVGQRTGTYDGQYAPEVIAAADEYTNEEFYEYLSSEEEKARNSGDFSTIAITTVVVPREAIEAALRPTEIKGEVQTPEESTAL